MLFSLRWEGFRKLGALVLNGKTLLQLIVLHSDAAKKNQGFCSDLNYDSLLGLGGSGCIQVTAQGGKNTYCLKATALYTSAFTAEC